VGLLLSQGHVGATRYPIAYLWNEVQFTRDRMNVVMASEAVIMKATISQAIWGTKELKELLEKLNGD
jgi:hypothetical protein